MRAAFSPFADPLRLGILICLSALSGFAVGASLSPSEASSGWILLFDGASTVGWTSDGHLWRAVANTLAAESPDPTSLRTNSAFADFELHCEFRVHGSASIYLRVPPSLNLQEASRIPLDDGDPSYPLGSLAGEKKATSLPPGLEWRSLDILAAGDHLSVRVDGQVAVDATTTRNKVGPIVLRSGSATKAEFRDIRLRPVGTLSLYNANNLDGWKLTYPAAKEDQGPHRLLKVIPLPSSGSKKPSADWSVENGFIHVVRGPGQLETQAQYDDFILQLDIRDNAAKGMHSGASVALRGQPNVFASGYESPINNESKDRDKSPQGRTGSLARFQDARQAAVENGHFFTETIVAKGRHIAVWVNGFPVTDFEDRRAPGPNLATEARIGKGTLALVASGSSANLDFRNIRLAELSSPPPVVSKASPPPAPLSAQPPTSAAPPAPPPAATPPSTPLTQMAQPTNRVIEQIASQRADEERKQQVVGQLMQQGLSAKTPEQQVGIYNQILRIDPANPVAFNARKEAQEKIDSHNAELSRQSAQYRQEQEQNSSREQRKRQALENAERALLRGDLRTSNADMILARKLAPRDPEVQRLTSIVDSRLQLRTRLMYLIFGTSSLSLVAICMALVRRRRRRVPYLLLEDGWDRGKEYLLKSDITRIGAIAKDGGVQNDIVIRDLDRSVSRFHCEIHQERGRLYLVDCDSSNGTFVDGTRIEPATPVRIGRGSRIRLGSCSMKLDLRGQKS